MAQVILNGPVETTRWCIACLMAAKQKQWEMHQEAIQAAYAAPASDDPVVIAWPQALYRELFHGDYRAVCGELPMLGVVDALCWNHVAGVNPTEAPAGPSPLVEARGQVPPGLRRRTRP